MQLYSFENNEQPSTLGHNLQGIQHFGFTTPDLTKSLKFYIDILGGRLAVGGDGFYGEELHNLLRNLQLSDRDCITLRGMLAQFNYVAFGDK